MPSLLLAVFRTRILGRVVKALDLSPSGLSPRGFEPRSMQCGKPFCPSAAKIGSMHPPVPVSSAWLV